MSNKLFTKLDNYLSIVENEDCDFEEKVKAYKNACIRFKKIKKKINDEVSKIKEETEETEDKEDKEENIEEYNINKFINDTNDKIENFHNFDLEEAVAVYTDSIYKINNYMNKLNETNIEINKAKEGIEKIELINIDDLFD